MKAICIKDFQIKAFSGYDIIIYKKDEIYEYNFFENYDNYEDIFKVIYDKEKELLFCDILCDLTYIEFCEYFITLQQQRKMKMIKINKEATKLNQ